MRLARLPILCCGVAVLALTGGAGAYVYLRPVAMPSPTTVPLAKTDGLPAANRVGPDWHTVDAYLKLQVPLPTEPIDDKALRAARQADLRRRLQPPLLPQLLVADAMVKQSPKSHWDNEGERSGDDTGKARAASLASADASAVAMPQKAVDTLVSDHARETIATLEAFKLALRDTGGDKAFPAEGVATPYTDH